jgi:type IV secretory pathway TrbL component
LKPDFYVGIIQYFGHLTTPIQFNGNILTGFNAGEVFTQFNTWLMKVYTPIQSNLGWSDAGKAVSYAFLCVIYLMCTCVISLMVIILEVEIYMTIFGALVLTGFAGSSWTYGMWNRYLDMVIGLGVRVMVFGMLYGILIKLINIDINTAGSMDVISSTITIILVTMCLWIIPSKIAGIVSGSAAGHSLAEAAGAALGGFALGKRFGFGNKPSGGGGGYPMPNPKSPPVPSPNPNPETPKNPTDNSIPNPGKSAPTKPMPPEYINKNKTK